MIQVPPSKWKDIAPPVYVCTIPFKPEELERKYSIRFKGWVEEGLGMLFNAFVEIEGSLFWFRACDTEIEKERHVYIYMLATESEPERSLQKINETFSINENELDEKNPDLGPACWKLVRLDDNGNEVEMFSFLYKDRAELAKSIYEKKGHKQSYFVKNAI